MFNNFGAINGVRVIYSDRVLEDTDVRLFPKSKNRSNRILKKLKNRFGGEFKKQPCIWKTEAGIIAHPSFRSRIQSL